MPRTSFKLLLLCAFLLLAAFIRQADDSPLDRLLANLQRWTDSIPQEKVYLHMDKPYYAVGDTIWFKGYVTIGSRHQLSALSGALYVDLINNKDSVVKDLKLPVTSGMVVGNFILGDDYNEGSYRIRAYTQWMRNAGSDYFFDHTFAVGDIGNRSLVARADYQYKDNNGKPMLTALLTFTNDEGKAVAERNMRYEIVIGKKTVWQQNTKTDALGSIRVDINNENKAELSGAYIRATFDGLPGYNYPVVRDLPIKAALRQSDVQFFPESGDLINGISSRIAFKATGVDGLGLNIKGKIIDQDNKEITTFETLHAGMGSFMIRPQAGRTYKANITFADGTGKTLALPNAQNEGYTLSVYQPNKDSVLLRINASPARLHQQVSLIAQTGGEVIFASPVKIEKGITSIWLEKKSFPTGIAQFTLFDNNGQPLNERIAFIRSNDQMQLSIRTNKTTYGSKEKVEVELQAKDSKGQPTAGNFSVTVIDDSKLPVEESRESTIFSNLLLTSDLKGYVEQPNYYFTKDNEEVNKALDNLMLTQGYRRFIWKELNTTANTKPTFKAEGLGTDISGRVTTLTGKALADATVNLISPRAKLFEVARTDKQGTFSFKNLFLLDSLKLTLQARGKGNSDKVKLILDTIPKLPMSPNPNMGDVSTDIAQTMKTYIENGKKLDDYYEQTGQLDKVHRLREVRIRARKKSSVKTPQYGIRIPEGSADHTYIIPKPENCANLGMCLQAALRGVVFKQFSFFEGSIEYTFDYYPFYNQSGISSPLIRVVIDGRPIELKSEIGALFSENTFDITEIIKIETVTTNAALMGILGGPSVLIYTKRGAIKKFYSPGLANISPKGFNRVREFYKPKYNSAETSKLADLRTTVYWDPYLKAGIDGKTIFNFFSTDGPSRYKVIIEGINANGQLGRQVFTY